MKHPLVSVAIPAWNLWPMTRDCLISLATNSPSEILEVCVVDNGSSDETAKSLEPLGKKLFGNNFKLIRFSENRGFAIASNEAARRANGQFILFLNNDTLALPDWLPPLLESFTNKKNLGAVGPLLLYDGGERVQHCGVTFSYGGVQHLYAFFPANHPAIGHDACANRNLQALTAAALFMPRKLFLEVGLFHEGYINGFEDLDLCRTLQKKGLNLRCQPQSKIIHKESLSPGRKDHDSQNAALYAKRWSKPLHRDIYDFAARDNLAVFLNDCLETCICLPPHKEKELNRLAENIGDVTRLWDMLRNNPVWRGGYDALALALSNIGHYDDMVFIRSLQCQFFPGPDSAAALLAASRLSKKHGLAQMANEDYMRQKGIASDIKGLRRKALYLKKQAREDNRPEVEVLYLDWLKYHPA